MTETALFMLFSELPREGVGSDDVTRKAISLLPSLPSSPNILDIGCGSGKQTLVLAQELQTPITAIDISETFLQRLEHSAASLGLSELIKTRCADMASLSDTPDSVDLIWAEGSIFVVGFANGLKLWYPLLSQRGLLVVSECSWLIDNPPSEASVFWQQAYPEMATVNKNIETANKIGFQVFNQFTLPDSAWWDEYYNPLRARITKLRSLAVDNQDLAQVIKQSEREMEIFANYGDSYGYVFYLMQKINNSPLTTN